MSSRKGKIYHNPAIYLQPHEGKACCSALFGHVAREKETWPRKIDKTISTAGCGRLEPLNFLWIAHSPYTRVLFGRLLRGGISSAYRHDNPPLSIISGKSIPATSGFSFFD